MYVLWQINAFFLIKFCVNHDMNRIDFMLKFCIQGYSCDSVLPPKGILNLNARSIGHDFRLLWRLLTSWIYWNPYAWGD